MDPDQAAGEDDGLSPERAAALIGAACSSDPRAARDLLTADPALALHDFACACATGQAREVGELLAANPALANTPQGPLNRAPLLYATFSRLPRLDPAFADGVRDVVRLLLGAGADPNAWFDHDGWLQVPLYGAAGILGDPAMTRMLIEAGADPNDCYDRDGPGEALYHAAEHADPTCAALLIEAGTRRDVVDYCLGRALNFDNHAMVAMWCAHGVIPSAGHLQEAVSRRRPLETIGTLLDAGAPVDGGPARALTPLRWATRWGMDDAAELLLRHGADAARVNDDDRLLGAYLRADAVADGAPNADAIRAAVPVESLAQLCGAAIDGGDLRAVRLLLDAGAPLDGLPDDQFAPIGWAAWHARPEIVGEYAARGAKLVFDRGGSAIGAALDGSLNCHHPEGGPTMQIVSEIPTAPYREAIELLLAAGAPVPEHFGEQVASAPRLAELGVRLP